MAIWISCTQCKKKISVDEAFAGGICRCPYCKALVEVGKISAGSSAATVRPDCPAERSEAPAARPGQPAERPEAPAERPAAPPACQGISAEPSTNPPEAEPAGVVGAQPGAVVCGAQRSNHAQPAAHDRHHAGATRSALRSWWLLLGISTPLLLGIIAAIIVYVKFGPSAGQAGSASSQPSPAGAIASPPAGPIKGPAILDVPLLGPVIYCVDTSMSFRPSYSYAARIVSNSISTLSAGEKFNVMLMGGKVLLVSDGYAGRAEGKAAANELLAKPSQPTAFLLPEIVEKAASLTPPPATVVLITKKSADEAALRQMVEKAKSINAKLICLAMDASPEAANALAAAAAGTGGQSRAYTLGELDELTSRFTDEP